MRRSFLFLLLASPVLASAQTGTNNTCATAHELEVFSGNIQQTLIPVDGRWFANAVPAPTTACSGSNPTKSAWYKFTATATQHWIRTDGQGTDDAGMEVFSGGCGNLTSIGCFPPNGATPALTGLTVGGTYHLRVVMINPDYCQPNPQLCQVWIAVVSAPVNDECSGAIDLPVITDAMVTWPAKEISSLGATPSQAACSGGADDDVWYRFTATHTTHLLGTKDLTIAAQDNVYQWFSGTCGNLTSLVCDQPMAAGLTPGTSYYIRAHSNANTALTTMRVLANVYAPAPNDECAGALPIEVSLLGEEPKAAWVSTVHGTASTVPCGPQPHDVWLSFTAPGPVVTAAVYGPASAHLALFSGSCGSLTCIHQANANDEVTFSGLTPGTTYYMKVGTNLINRGNLRVYVFEPAMNAACADAVLLEVQNDDPVYTLGNTYNATERAWYRFIATGPHMIVEGATTAGEYPTTAKVYSGACGAQTMVAQSASIAIPLVLTGLTAGQEYHIMMDPQNPVAFRIAVRGPLANDECAGAIELPFSTLEDFPSIVQESNMLAANGTGACLATRDLWYRFTAAHSSAGFVTPDASGTTELFTGGCGSLTSLGCESNTIAAQFSGLEPGTEYHIRFSTTAVIHAPMLFDQPVNDEPGGALPAPFGSRFAIPAVAYSSYGSSQSMPSHCAGYVPDTDTWYTFTATAGAHSVLAILHNGYFTEDQFGTNLYTRIEVYDTLSTDPAVLAANLISCGDSPRVLTGLTIGKQYLYRVYTYGLFATNKARGFITAVTDADNDDAGGALLLAYTDTYSAWFNTTGATQSMPGADCLVDDTADDDIWFKFVATNATARLVVGDGTADVTIELFSGTPGNLTSIACDGNILELPVLTAGQTYHARVYSRNNATPVSGRMGLIATPSLTANSCVDEDCLGPVLVPNPGIEQGAECLIHLSEVGAIQGLGTQLAPGWPRMQHGSSDAFHSCAPFNSELENPGRRIGQRSVLSRSGKAMGGFIATGHNINPYYFEYLQAPLSEPLVPGEAYLVSFHVAPATPNVQCVSGLGAALSEGPLVVSGYHTPIAVDPDVLEPGLICEPQWTNICGVVVPGTPVDHITIGLFRTRREGISAGNTNQYSFYYVDDVVVARVNDPSCITSIGDVPPDEFGQSEQREGLRLYPNPANELVNIVADPSLFGQRAVIEVFDMRGTRVHAEEVAWFGAVQPVDLSGDLKEGLYLVMVRVEGQAPKAARLVVKR